MSFNFTFKNGMTTNCFTTRLLLRKETKMKFLMKTKTKILDGNQKFGKEINKNFWKEAKMKILEGNQNINFERKPKTLSGKQIFWKETQTKILEENQTFQQETKNFKRKPKILERKQKFWKETKKNGKEVLTSLVHHS